MLNIAVCDDDPVFLSYMETRIGQYCRKNNIESSINIFDNASDFWHSFTSRVFNIVFLDVIMPDISGIDLSQKIFRHNRSCVIAFISSSPDFAIEGYGVNAVGYLVKPPGEEEFFTLMDRCLERYGEIRSRLVVFKTGALTRKIEADKILCLESRNKQVIVHCRDETLVVPGKLSAILDNLPASFIQTHKSYVANLDHVKSMTREEMSADNEMRIPVSRQFHKDAMRRYLDYTAGEA